MTGAATNDQTVTQALEPCPFCGGVARIETTRHQHPPSHWVECAECEALSGEYASKASAVAAWNTRTAHSGEGRSTFDPMQADKAVTCDMMRQTEALNNRPEIQVGRSNGAGEIDPSKMSVEMADLFGLVCKLNRLKTERDDLMRTDGGFSVIERAADMMDEIVDAMPALQSAFNKVCERERLLLAALAQPEAGGE